MPVSMDKYAPKLIRLARQYDAPPERAARETAISVGRHAVRLGWGEDELSEWLSHNYGRVWVKETALKPGLDLKDVRKYALRELRDDKLRLIYIESRGWTEYLKDIRDVPMSVVIEEAKKYAPEEVARLIREEQNIDSTAREVELQ